MEFGELQERVHGLLVGGQPAQAEELLLQAKVLYKGRTLGRWYHLFAGVLRRRMPYDQERFQEACACASRLLQGDHEGLCALYLLQSSEAIVRGDWHQARTFIRRSRTLIARYPAKYEIQRFKGSVLINEGLVERAATNFRRAIWLLHDGIESMEHLLFPVDKRTRVIIATMAYLDIADSYLRLHQAGDALRVLSRVNEADLPPRERGRHSYVQSRYYLELGMVRQAREWFDRIGATESWDPDWPALLLEIQAGIARVENRPRVAQNLLGQAAKHAANTHNHVLTHILRRELTLSAMEGE